MQWQGQMRSGAAEMKQKQMRGSPLSESCASASTAENWDLVDHRCPAHLLPANSRTGECWESKFGRETFGSVKVREHNSEGEGFCAHDSAPGSILLFVGFSCRWKKNSGLWLAILGKTRQEGLDEASARPLRASHRPVCGSILRDSATVLRAIPGAPLPG